MRTHIIYIPGLGSRYNSFRKLTLSLWRIYGVSATLIPFDWYDGSSFEQKIKEVEDIVGRLGANSRIVIIGESAGASIALHAAQLPNVRRVITLCGVAQPGTPISSYLQTKSPALLDATRSIPNTENYDVHSVRAVADSVVGKKYSSATGAKSHVIYTVGHFATIVICLTVLSLLMVTIAKKSKM